MDELSGNAAGQTKPVVGVTGASGHLGGALCRQLLAAGYPVRALVHSDRRAIAGLDLIVCKGDILDPASLDAFAAGCAVVVHSAAIISIAGDPDGQVFRHNVGGTQNIIAACLRQGVARLIQVSSSHAVMEQLEKPRFDETNALKPEGSFAYDRTKAQGEELAQSAFRSGQIDGCVVRPSSIIGPFDFKPSKMGKAMLDLRRGAVPVLPPGGYNFVDVRDVAAAIVAAINQGKTGETYLLSGHYATMAEFADLIAHSGGKPAPRLKMPFRLLYLLLPLVSLWARLSQSEQAYTREMLHVLHKGHPHMDNSKAKRELGLAPRSLAESIADYFAWIQAQEENS